MFFLITEADSSSEEGEDSSDEEGEVDVVHVASTEPPSDAPCEPEPVPETSTGIDKFYLDIFNLI